MVILHVNVSKIMMKEGKTVVFPTSHSLFPNIVPLIYHISCQPLTLMYSSRIPKVGEIVWKKLNMYGFPHFLSSVISALLVISPLTEALIGLLHLLQI